MMPYFGIFAVDKVELFYVNLQLVENVKYSWSQHWREPHQMIFSDNHRLKKWFEHFIKFFSQALLLSKIASYTFVKEKRWQDNWAVVKSIFIRQIEILKILSETMDPLSKDNISKSSTVFTKRLSRNLATLVQNFV